MSDFKNYSKSPGAKADISPGNAVSLSASLMAVTRIACNLGLFDEAETMRLAAKAIYPELPGIDAYKIIILMGREDFSEALRIIGEREDTVSLGHRAYCLYKLGDPLWVIPGREAYSRGDEPEISEGIRNLFEIKGIAAKDIATPPATMSYGSIPKNGGIRA